ncbi:hypothetical protein [Embleya sp. NBC_00896]|uniref:hypothetical protein n=1 Tax=Embleya sp. NBC_00896 TaxID=2975961 RepID=UPI0038635D55|nr:hypothetical protein OG928_00385 [Embleya sp. NBC_00896]
MSRDADIIVLAHDAEAVMEPLTRPDDTRTWPGFFKPVDYGDFYRGLRQHDPGAPSSYCYMWIINFGRPTWHSLLPHLETLPWPRPESVQVLVRDEEDDCFGLWMMYDGRLTEVPLPRTERKNFAGPPPGVLLRSDR